MHKTKLTQNNKAKYTSNAKQKYEGEREKAMESPGALFLPHLGRVFPLSESLNRRWGGKIEIVQVQKEHEGFEKISKGQKWMEIDSGFLMRSCHCSVE